MIVCKQSRAGESPLLIKGTLDRSVTKSDTPREFEINWPKTNVLEGKFVERYFEEIENGIEEYRKAGVTSDLRIDLRPIAIDLRAELKAAEATRRGEFPGGMF